MPPPGTQVESSPGLVFITQTGPARRKEQQTLIRKHVMKDIGKSRRKEKRNDKPNTLNFTLEIPDAFHEPSRKYCNEKDSGCPYQPKDDALLCDDIENQIAPKCFIDAMQQPQLQITPPGFHEAASTPPRIERVWTGRIDPFVEWPIKMNRRTFELMDHVFDDRYGNTPTFRNVWLPVGMLSPASFHQILCNAAMSYESLRAKGDVPEQTEPMMHHSAALRIIAKEINDDGKAKSDGVLVAIIGFACYSHVTGKQKQWNMHMKAVQELVKLRGGIESLYSNPLLRAVLLWVDVCGAVPEDTQPHFPLPLDMIPAQAVGKFSQESHLARQISYAWRLSFPEQAKIMDIMTDMRSWTSLLQHEVTRTKGEIWKDGTFAAYGLLPILHGILSLSSESSSNQQQKLDIVRFGCLLYFAEIRRLFGIMGVIPAHQTTKLRVLLEQQTDDWGVLEILKVWVLALAAIESLGNEREWFLEQLQISKDRLDIDGWEELEPKFEEILWYRDIHSVMFGEVFSGDQSENRMTSYWSERVARRGEQSAGADEKRFFLNSLGRRIFRSGS